MTAKKKRLPDFNKMTYEEEAMWWETYNPEEFEDEFVEGEPFKIAPGALSAPKELRELSRQLVDANLESAINIRLSKHDHNKLRTVARQKGIGTATLVRMWILEHINAIQKFSSMTFECET